MIHAISVMAGAALLALTGGSAVAQSADTNAPVVSAAADVERKWSFSASAYTYVVPGEPAYVQPTVTADRGWLHLEARYNYEDLETGSAWVGYNFAGGEKLA